MRYWQRRALVLAGAVLVASCASGSAPADLRPGGVGTQISSPYAPRFSPLPPRRGVAPVEVVIPGGVICGDPRLLGRRIGAIRGSNPACGIAEPVSVSSVSGVALTRPARLNCEAAIALADWTDQSAKPQAQSSLQTTLKAMLPVASYACRTRNSQPGARVSEHARGNAVDIASFTFADGRSLSVLNDWRSGGQGQSYLRNVWKGACGPFGTVLGPGSDRFHQDHFHFDIARYRSGPYCK